VGISLHDKPVGDSIAGRQLSYLVRKPEEPAVCE